MFIGFNTQAQHLTIIMANMVSILSLLLELDLVPLETLYLVESRHFETCVARTRVLVHGKVPIKASTPELRLY
jgi:hypothetical protein